MLAHGGVELDGAFVAFGAFEEGAGDAEDVAVRVPLHSLDEHACVDQDGDLVLERAHELESSTLVRDAQLGGSFIDVFIAEALAV